MLERACAAVADGFGFERVGIIRYFPETSTLVPFAGYGLTSSETRVLPPVLPLAHFGAFRRALATSRAVFVEDPNEEDALPEGLARGFGLGSFVIVPLVSDGRCLGFLTCDVRGGRFTLEPPEIDLLTTFGTLIAAFLEKAIEHGELRRLNELKSQFAALASHELRTPAAAIYGAVRTLDEREEELAPEQRAEIRRMLTQQAQRLLELVENLLDLSRLEADSIRISPTRIDVGERLAAIIDAAVGEGVTLDTPRDLEAVVDAVAFDRIVSNLLANALLHGAPPVIVSAARTGDELRVERGRRPRPLDRAVVRPSARRGADVRAGPPERRQIPARTAGWRQQKTARHRFAARTLNPSEKRFLGRFARDCHALLIRSHRNRRQLVSLTNGDARGDARRSGRARAAARAGSRAADGDAVGVGLRRYPIRRARSFAGRARPRKIARREHRARCACARAAGRIAFEEGPWRDRPLRRPVVRALQRGIE